jgi:hypothetical protein
VAAPKQYFVIIGAPEIATALQRNGRLTVPVIFDVRCRWNARIAGLNIVQVDGMHVPPAAGGIASFGEDNPLAAACSY